MPHPLRISLASAIRSLYIPIMLDLEILHGDHVPRCTVRIDRRFAGYHTLQALSGGALDWACDGRERRLAGAWCWGTPAGPRLRYGPAAAPGWWDHRYVAFAGPLADRWQAEGLIPADPEPMPDPAGFVRGLDRLLALVRRADAVARRLAANQLERLLLELAEARAGGPGAEDPLTAAIAAAGDPERRIGLTGLARLAGCSPVHLRRRFVAATGLPPLRYINLARLRRARALLAEGDLPVKAIAERLGFSDVQHFTRRFAADTGQPPAAWRRTARGG